MPKDDKKDSHHTRKRVADLPGNKAKDIEQKVAELTAALQRERADAVNLRRRHEAELAALGGRAKVGIVHELLPVIDNFERALKHVPPKLKDDGYVKGVQAVVKQFEQTLEQMGVQRIKSVGERFDPHLHEAVGMEEGDGGHPIISEELQAGYRLGDDVIRHAMVKVKG